MLDTTNMDSQAVFAAENRYAELMKGKGLDASPGSALRELVVRPSAVLSSLEEAWRKELTSSLDLYAIANGAVEGDDELVDALASIYGIRRRGGSSSAGVISLSVNYAGHPVYINQSWGFSAAGHSLQFSGIYVGSIDGTAGDGLAKKERLVKYPSGVSEDGTVSYSYSMMIPVTCEDGADIAAGTAVDVTGPSTAVSSAVVFSPVTGGGDVETNQELAKRILEALPPGVMSTPLQIKNTLSERFGLPVTRVSVVGGQQGLERAVDSLTGLALPGFADVFVAAEGDCPVETVDVTAVPVAGYANSWVAVLDPPVSSGVYDVLSLLVDGVQIPLAGDAVTWGQSSSTLHVIPDGTARFSSWQTVAVRFIYSSGADSLPCQVVVRKQPFVQSIQDFIDSDERRAPGQDIVVKAATPVFLSASITVEKGASVSLETMKDAVCRHVNSLPVGRGYVSGQDFVDALNPLGVKVAFPIGLTANVITAEGAVGIVASNGRLEIGFTSSDRTVFYLSSDNLGISTNES